MSAEILITGLGMVSPAGARAATTWAGLLEGRRCVKLPAGGASPAFAGACAQGCTPLAEPSCAGRHERMLNAGCEEAIASAKLISERSFKAVFGFSKIFPDLVPSDVQGGLKPLSNDLLYEYIRSSTPLPRIPGRHHVVVAACASGTYAVIRAAQMIADGDAEVVLCGAADASLHPLWLAAFDRMGVLGAAGNEPARTCRPFDATRQGFAIGEGAAVLVLESAESARSRGAKAIARIEGYAVGTDPVGMTQVSPDGQPLARVITHALQAARRRPDEIRGVLAHGTGTVANDLAETRAVRLAFGAQAKKTPIVSVKGAVGHLLGAAGALEVGIAALSCAQGVAPGNVTLEEPDPELRDLALPRERFHFEPGAVLKTAAGFGGHLGAIIVGPPR